MAGFLLFDGSGVKTVAQLPRIVFAYAMSGTDVVYAEVGRVPAAPPPPLRPYTLADSQTRRAKCQTELAHLATVRRGLTGPAVQRVTVGINAYLDDRGFRAGGAIGAAVAGSVKRYLYSDTGYGRVGQKADAPRTDAELLDVFRQTLESGSLPSVLAVHDFMGRKVFAEAADNPAAMEALFRQVGNRVRPAYLFGRQQPLTVAANGAARTIPAMSETRIEQLRGRVRVAGGRPAPTDTPGVLPAGSPAGGLPPHQVRERGVDLWQPAATDPPPFTKDVQDRGLLFGAGPSGSTGTLLQAGMVFGGLAGELLKQYALAVVGYLVGGGMHTYHEVMSVCARVGVPYRGGVYDESLPGTFLGTPDYRAWRDRYFDIVVLGWRTRLRVPGTPPRP